MTSDRIDSHQRRHVIEDDSRSHLVRPQRNPERLFSGWGPKL